MKVLVTGAAGMIGRKFCQRLARDGAIGGKPVTALHMVDIVAAGDLPGASFAVASEAANIADRGLAPRLIADRPDLIVHLAAIVSGEAEVDFDKG
ncbi:MAG: NAD-dependent epimerase/dehydratase family protein, partial [Rhodoblastus sp.]|nr:NAD-dependent epimerase/dehydratase family protein [Rhodoblastus sp.]